jgi:hypothetical protein
MRHVVVLSALSSEVPREQIRLDVMNSGENPRFGSRMVIIWLSGFTTIRQV